MKIKYGRVMLMQHPHNALEIWRISLQQQGAQHGHGSAHRVRQIAFHCNIRHRNLDNACLPNQCPGRFLGIISLRLKFQPVQL